MADGLPYFKFKVSEWNDGKIVDCSMEAQGLFINLCSLYWSRLGALDNATAMRKLCNRYATAFKELKKMGVLKVSEDHIFIDFLDEQLGERKVASKKARENALKRWKQDATAMRPHSDGNAEEKREEEKRREIDEDALTGLSSEVNLFLKRKTPNTMDVRMMVRQWMEAGHDDIMPQLKAMRIHYDSNNLTFPTRIETLTQSFMETDWVQIVKEADPERKAERIANQTVKAPEHDDIGTSEPGSLI